MRLARLVRSPVAALSHTTTIAAAARPATAATANGMRAELEAGSVKSTNQLASSPSSSSLAPRSSSRASLPPRPLINLLSLTLPSLEAELASMSVQRFRARQLLHWVYDHGVSDIDQMDNFSRSLKEQLKQRFHVSYGQIIEEQVSQNDFTRKFLVGFPSARSKLAVPSSSASSSSTPSSAISNLDQIECVYIPMGKSSSYSTAKEGAVCVSSQVGCSLSCTFCHTGTMDKKKLRNLTSAEIVGQVMIAQHAVGDFTKNTATATAAAKSIASTASSSSTAARSASSSSSSSTIAPSRGVTSIVLMGMGEPLYNYRQVRGAIDLLTSSPRVHGIGLGFGRGRVTLSTSGVVPGIDALLSDYGGNVSLAISLHACNDQLRNEIVPINKTYPIASLMEAVRRYQNGRVITASSSASSDDFDPSGSSFSPIIAGRKRITFEYVMLRGVNDDLGEALALARLLDGIVSLVNLIPFNPWPGSNYQASEPEHIIRFAEELHKLGVPCTIRWPRGRDIQGACGQLAIKHATAAAEAATGAHA